MNSPIELVRLMDQAGNQIGTANKADVHTSTTPLHLAFSCHVLDASGRTLVTRRALHKKTWPGVWTNSFCGHPAPGESFEDAIARRAQQELGIEVTSIEVKLPNFRYEATDVSGIMENEICPVFTAIYTGPDRLEPNPEEVCDWAWTVPNDLQTAVDATPYAFSPWLVLQQEQGLKY